MLASCHTIRVMRLLRDIAEGKALGDATTLADPDVIEKLNEKYAHLAE